MAMAPYIVVVMVVVFVGWLVFIVPHRPWDDDDDDC